MSQPGETINLSTTEIVESRMDSVRRILFDNPVILRELRSGLREKRLIIILMMYAIVLLFSALVSLPSIVSNAQPENLPEIGKGFFEGMYWVQVVVLALIMPSLTCGAISGERERHSLDMVLASRLTSFEIVAGKLGYALYYLVLLLFVSLPISSVSFFFGGVSAESALSAYFELALYGTLWALFGLFFSSREHRSNYATSQTYGTVLLSSFTLPYLFMLSRYEMDSQTNWALGWLTPIRICQVFLIYFAMFLYLKCMQRLKPRASTLRTMGWMFLVFYSLAWILLLFLGVNHSDVSAPAMFLWISHLVLAGMFCNDYDLPSQKEAESFKKSWFSRPLFWQVVFCLYLLIPQVLQYFPQLGSKDYILITGCQLCCIYVLAFPLMARAIQRVLRGSQFVWVYFIVLTLSCSLPTLGLLFDKPDILSGVYLSPILGFAGLGSDDAHQIKFLGHLTQISDLSALAYLFFILISGMILLLVKPRKPS